jgi:hypothetical protein
MEEQFDAYLKEMFHASFDRHSPSASTCVALLRLADRLKQRRIAALASLRAISEQSAEPLDILSH